MYRYLCKQIFILVLGFSTLLYAQEQAETAVSDEIQSKLEQGKQMLLNGNFTAAEAVMQQLAFVNPELGAAHFYMGVACVGKDRTKKGVEAAQPHFLAAARAGFHVPFGTWEDYPIRQSSYVDANWNPAKDILDEKDPQQLEIAAHLLENIVSVDHRAHHASERLGELYVKTGQNRKALDLFQRLLEANPDRRST